MNDYFSIMPDFLCNPDAFFKSVRDGEKVKSKASAMALTSIMCLVAYGFMVGLAKSPLQALSSAVKMAVTFVGVSAVIGVHFLWRGMTLVDIGSSGAQNQLSKRILMLWFILYAFVGTQMTWRLPPFIGRTEDPFFLLKPSRDNFYVDVINAASEALNISSSASFWVTPVLLGGMCLLSVGGLIFFSGLIFGKSPKQREESTQIVG